MAIYNKGSLNPIILITQIKWEKLAINTHTLLLTNRRHQQSDIVRILPFVILVGIASFHKYGEIAQLTSKLKLKNKNQLKVINQ